MKTYKNALELANVIFKRDIRPTLASSFSAIFLGKLRILLECDNEKLQYTYLKKPGVAVIHLGSKLVCQYTVDELSNPIPPESAYATAKKMKTFYEAFAYHEIGHLLYTDMTGEALKIIETKYAPFTGFIKDMMNVLEDPKMERLMAKDLIYKFTRPYFALATKSIFIPQARNYKDNGSVADLVNYILLYLRCGPKVLTAHNAMFDSLVPKGIYDKIKECHRENDPMKRAQKQVAFAIWLIDELDLKPQSVGAKSTTDRPIIIIVDKTSTGVKQQKPLMPKDAPLPPVSVVEADDEEDDEEEEGEQPDADIIDTRKKKPESKEKDDDSDKQGSGKTSSKKEKSEDEEESEDGETEEEPSEDDGESKSNADEEAENTEGQGFEDEEEENDEESSQYSEDSEDSEDSEEDFEDEEESKEESKEESESSDNEDGEDDEEDDEDQTSSSPKRLQSQAGHEMGSETSSIDPDFEWEFGNEDPIEIMEENTLISSPDPDLESALEVENDANSSQVYEAKTDYEVLSPEVADGLFSGCAVALGNIPATLADVIKQLKAESADYERHLLSDGEEIDVDDYLDVLASGSTNLDVYKDEVKGREITDLAVSVLVDCSGSMCRDKSMFAYSTSVMVALACEEAEVPCEFAAFSTRGVMYVKHFEEKWEDAKDILGMLCADISDNYLPVSDDTLHMWGGTELEEALPIIFANLRKYEEKQAKLVFVITDGDTGNTYKAGQLIRQAREEGIVVIGIGVGTSERNLRACFEHCHSFSARSLEKLPEYIAQQIEEAISSDNFSGY